MAFSVLEILPFIRAGDFSLSFLCKISIACLTFSKVAFVVLFPKKNGFTSFRLQLQKIRLFGRRKRVLTLPICFYNILLDYDVSLHILVVLVVTFPTSPRISKTEFV